MTRRLFSFAFGALIALAASAAHAQTNATAAYVINLAGANVATVEVKLGDEGPRYTLEADAQVTGLGQLVASGSARIRSSGALDGDGLDAHRFDLLTRAGGEDFSVRIEYAGAGNVSAFVVTPPLLNNIDRVPLERKHLRGVNDMLAAFVLRGKTLDRSVCERRMRIFTGLERFDIEMRYAADDVATSARTGYQGPVVLCKIRYVPVSGHFTTSEMTTFLAGSDRILIWYAPLGSTGYLIPYRVLITTSVGDLSMVLTATGT